MTTWPQSLLTFSKPSNHTAHLLANKTHFMCAVKRVATKRWELSSVENIFEGEMPSSDTQNLRRREIRFIVMSKHLVMLVAGKGWRWEWVFAFLVSDFRWVFTLAMRYKLGFNFVQIQCCFQILSQRKHPFQIFPEKSKSVFCFWQNPSICQCIPSLFFR